MCGLVRHRICSTRTHAIMVCCGITLLLHGYGCEEFTSPILGVIMRLPAHHRQRPQGRIPLKDVIRFKERQWFVEELEVGG